MTAALHVDLQTIFLVLRMAGLIAVVVGIWYGGSLLLLGIVSRLFPLTGRRTRAARRDESSSND